MSALPKTIKIGGLTFAVSLVDALHTSDGGSLVELSGNIQYAEGKILLRTGQSADFNGTVLLHEIMHGVLYHAGVETHEELFVDQMANGLYQVLGDTPRLVSYLTAGSGQDAPLPDGVKIGGIEYAVRLVEGLVDTLDDGTVVELNGHIRWMECDLELNAGLGEGRMRVALLHEIMHGILDHAGEESHDERSIRIASYGMLQVLRDNPALVTYLRNSRYGPEVSLPDDWDDLVSHRFSLMDLTYGSVETPR